MASNIEEKAGDHIFLSVRTNLYKAREIGTTALSDSGLGGDVIILNPHDQDNSFARLVYARLPRGSPLCDIFQQKKEYRELTEEEFKRETSYEILFTISCRFQVSITEISLGKYRSGRIGRIRKEKRQ